MAKMTLEEFAENSREAMESNMTLYNITLFRDIEELVKN
jgi:hypothetical protein